MTFEKRRRSDGELIAEGRRIVTTLLGKSNWELGDLALEYAGPPGEGNERLTEYTEEIGADSNMTAYRAVAFAYAPAERDPSIPWTCFRDVFRRDDRHVVMAAFIEHCRKNGITSGHYRALQKFDGRKPTSQFVKADAVEQGERAMEEMPVADAVRIAQAALTRPEVAAALPQALASIAQAQPEAFKAAYRQDQSIRRAVGDVQIEEMKDHHERVARNTYNDPVRRRLDQQAALSDLTEACSTFATAVEAILPRLGDLPANDAGGLDIGANHFLRTSLERAEGALHNVRTFITSGKTDIDQFLGSVLKGGR